ncbi:MAG: PKD domain-containing protein [Saprospiraceae bacterium]
MKKLPLLILLVLFFGNLQAQITAEFTASTTTGCGDTTIDFLDQSTSNGNITSWFWDFDNGNTSSEQNPTVNFITTGNYTICLTIEDDLGGNDMHCKTDFIIINSAPICVIDVNIPILSCANTTVTLNGGLSSSGPNFNYSWSTMNGNIVSGSTTLNAIVDTEGLYTLEVTNTTNGCSSSTSIQVTSDTNIPIANVSATQTTYTIICSTVSISPYYLDGTGSSTGPDYIYEWRDSDNNLISNDLIFGANDVGTYTLTVTDIVNLCYSTASVTIIIIENITPPIADAGPDQVLNCSVNGSVTLDGTGSNTSTGDPLTYEWSFNGVVISTTINPVVSQPGIYTLTIVDTNNGCTASDDVLVTVAPPNIALETTSVVCTGGVSTLSFSVTYINCQVEVVDAMGNVVCNQPCTGFLCTVNPTDGPFQITLTDLSTGCQNFESFSIATPNPIVISQTDITDVSCFGINDGAIEIEVIGGSPSYTYSWSNGSTAEDQFNLDQGIYTVTIVDANGCELVENFEVSSSSELVITDVQITNVSCTGTDDGSIDIVVEGGTLPYAFAWSNASTLPNQSNLVVGIYTVTITDSNGCTLLSPEYEIFQNACFDFANDTTICMGGIVSLSNDLPITGWNYSWSPATSLNDPTISNPIASPTETTTYFLTITNGSGMIIFSGEGPTVTVQSYLDFGLLDFSNAPLCDGDTLELYGNLGTIFVWTGPNGYVSTSMNPTINTVTELESGNYSLTITDDFGCTASADVDVFIDDDCVWPGDTDTNMVVNHFDLLNIGLAYDSVGTTRENASFDWFGQPSFDWSQTTPTSNVNYKHIDADGNGIIEAADTVAITQNFGLTHNFSDPDILDQFTDLPPSDGFTVVTPFYVEPDTLIEGETIALNLILGDVSNVVTGLYGIGFSIEYDSSVVVPGSASINFDDCWLGDVNADAISVQFDFPNPGRIDAAITRIDGVEMDGYGLFGDLIITLEDDILLWDPNSNSNNFNGTSTDVTADFTVTNYRLINFSQEEIIVQGTTTTAPIGETTSLSFIELNELITVFPNPANDVFFIASQNIDIERVRIFSATGELKSVKTKTKNNLEFSTKELPNGIYFIEIQTREGIVTKKLSVVK